MSALRLKVGDAVEKRSGYRFPGVVQAAFKTRSGLVRYVVEADDMNFRGMLHIYAPKQLRRRKDG